MQRPCDHCGDSYEAKRSTSKFCCQKCRVNSAQGKPSPASVTSIAPEPAKDEGLVATVRRNLESADRLDTVLGQQAIVLAGALRPGVSGMAAISRELTEVMDAALEGVTVVADSVDELRAARDRKRAVAN